MVSMPPIRFEFCTYSASGLQLNVVRTGTRVRTLTLPGFVVYPTIQQV